jgi:hypothetical protein
MLSKPFKINFKRLNDDIVSEANLERRRIYRERFNLEQKKEILSHWKKFMNEIESEIFYFDFVDEFYPPENTVKTITKEKWVKEDNTVVSSSHPPLETIVISHLKTDIKASPFKIASPDIEIRKVVTPRLYLMKDESGNLQLPLSTTI